MKFKIQILLIILAVQIVLSERNYDYCNIPTCDPGTHTFCKWKDRRIAARCGIVTRSELDPVERNVILNLHNEFRRLVFTGQAKSVYGRQPPAARPTALEWDYELEDVAHRWSIQCISGTDDCRDLEEFRVNQLWDWVKTDNKEQPLKIEDILWTWFNESTRHHPNSVHSFSATGSFFATTEHYTQLVWGNTQRVGCNAVRHTFLEFDRLKLVCNYGPKGQIEGEPLYIIR